MVSVDLAHAENWPRLGRIWYRLMRDRKVPTRYVYLHLLPEEISDQEKQEPFVKEQLERLGYFERSVDLDADDLAVLEALGELGYLEKRTTTIYVTWLNKDVWLYEPEMKPMGFVSLAGPRGFSSHSYHLEKEEYERAIEGFKELKRQVDEKKHPSIKDIRVGAEYSYESEVYQVRNAFFDALFLQAQNGELKVWLTVPLLETDKNRRDRKNWKRLGEIEAKLFLAGAEALRASVEALDWKKEAIGIVVFDDTGFRILSSGEEPAPIASEPRVLMQDLQEEFQTIRNQDDAGALRERFRQLARETLNLMRECDESSRQTPRCPIRPIFQATAKGRDLAAKLSDMFPTSRSEAGALAEGLTKLLWEDSENGRRISQVVLKDVAPLLRVIKELRHHERHDREVGSVPEVEKKFLEIGSFYEAMIGNAVPTTGIDWGRIGCCLLVVSRRVLEEVLSSIRALA